MPEEQTSLLEVSDEDNETPEIPSASHHTAVTVESVSAAAQTQPMAPVVPKETVAKKQAIKDDMAPMCYNCGNQTQRSGSCYVCTSCGSTTGCS